MINWFKKHFIPHDGNQHRPHFLHKENIRNVVAIVLFLEIFTFLLPTLTHINYKGGMAAVIPAVLATLTNEERQSQNLPVLTINPILAKAAEMKAEDMAKNSYFAHTSPEGKTPWYWLEQVGYKYQYAGENLAINFSDSKDVTNAWMNSPTHKANIIKDKYTEVGTGIATGIYEGKSTVFVAQVYANPLKVEPRKTQPIKPVEAVQKPVENVKIITQEEQIENVLGAEVNTEKENVASSTPETITKILTPTFWQKAFTSPRNTTNTILFTILGIIIFSLLLYIIIKMKNHHKDLITNGLIIVVLIGAIFIVNYYLSHKDMMITQSLDYSNEIK